MPKNNYTLHHTATDRTPYTYLIGWKSLDKWYYGVRYGRGVHPSDFWVSYFTSSRHVKNFREVNGEPDVIEIRKIFDSVDSARNWEHRAIFRMNMVFDQKFLNRTNCKAIHPDDIAKHLKGKTYEEVYGAEKAAALRHSRIQSNIDAANKRKPWNERKGDRVHGNFGSIRSPESNAIRRQKSTDMWDSDYTILRSQTLNTNFCIIKSCLTCSKQFDGRPRPDKQYCSNLCFPRVSKSYICTSPYGNDHIVDCLKNFCIENDLSLGAFRHVVTGRNKQHKGWTGRVAEDSVFHVVH